MQAKTAILYCDAEDGACGQWDLDYYAQYASAVDGVEITSTVRAPGRRSTNLEDFCPEHTPIR